MRRRTSSEDGRRIVHSLEQIIGIMFKVNTLVQHKIAVSTTETSLRATQLPETPLLDHRRRVRMMAEQLGGHSWVQLAAVQWDKEIPRRLLTSQARRFDSGLFLLAPRRSSAEAGELRAAEIPHDSR